MGDETASLLREFAVQGEVEKHGPMGVSALELPVEREFVELLPLDEVERQSRPAGGDAPSLPMRMEEPESNGIESAEVCSASIDSPAWISGSLSACEARSGDDLLAIGG